MAKFSNGISIEYVGNEVFSLYDGRGKAFVASEREIYPVLCGKLGITPEEFYRVTTEATGLYPTIEAHDAEFGEGAFLNDFGPKAYRQALLREPFDSAA